jgi:two-component system response regulator PilR (NtrC family)
MTETLLESELFGFVKGAFTGAVKSRPGVFESADRGSIFLDEIGDMTPAMQVKVLRVLQERKVRRIGAAAETTVDTRVIAATNRDLLPMVKMGAFRQDLFYRVSVIPLHVPSLDERREDIPELVVHFTNRFASRSGKNVSVTDEALDILTKRRWDGNVRELENTIERAVAFTTSGSSILPEHCLERAATNGQHSMHLPAEGLHLHSCLNEIEKRFVEEALNRCSGNEARAAELLRIPVQSLRHLLDKHGSR